MAASLPLVGRADELSGLAATRAAGAVGVVLAGPPGVGKSRVARAALAEAQAAGAAAVWIQATRSAAAIPLGAFAGALPLDVRSDDPLTLLRSSAHALVSRAGRRALVLAVDDAQLLDQTSAALVLHLARTLTAFVLATVRTGEPCPDAIVALWKDAGARRMELTTLDEAGTGALTEAVLDGPAEEGVRQWIWTLSAGNALYVSELLHGALADGSLERAAGLWRMRRRPRVAPSLAELISERLEGLRAGERRTLELLALGEPLPLSVAAEHESTDALVAVEDQQLVTLEDGGGDDPLLRLAHPLYGEAIRAGLPTLRAREIRLRLAGTLQRRDPLGPDDALRVARWLLEAHEPVPLGLLTDAASGAIRNGDPDLGATLAGLAGDGVDAALLLARAHTARNRFTDAAEVLAGAEARVETREQAIVYLEQQAAALNWGLNRPRELRSVLERAAGWWDDESWQRRLDPLRVGVEASLSPAGPGATVGRSGDLLSADTTDPQRRRELETNHLRALSHAGRGREAARLARALRPQPPLQDLWAESATAMWVGVSAETGEGWGELQRWGEETLPLAVRHEDHGAAGAAALGLGHLAYCAGRYRDAGRWLAEAQAHYEHHDVLGLLALVAAHQAGVACAVGDAADAQAACDRCVAAVRGDPPPRNQLPYRLLAEAWTAKARGDAEHAQRMLLAGAERVARTPLYGVRLAYEALRMGAAAAAVAPRLVELAERCDASLPEAEAAHVRALAGGDGAALLAAAERFAKIGALRYAAEAAADAARVYLAAGRQPEARRAAARSHGLWVPDQGAPEPEIPGLGPSTALSARERQLVELAASGLPNAEIAERLVISVRTVESHIYRAMQKLGVSDRRELTRLTEPAP